MSTYDNFIEVLIPAAKCSISPKRRTHTKFASSPMLGV